MMINSKNIIHIKESESILTRICEISQTFKAHIFLDKRAYERLKKDSLIVQEIRKGINTSLLKCKDVFSATLCVSTCDYDIVSVDIIKKDGYNPYFFNVADSKINIYLIC